MRFDLENLPSDTALLHRLVREMAVVVDSRDGESRLIWCPNNGRERIAAVIDGTKESLSLQNERYQDTIVIERLVRAVNRGIRVRIMARPRTSSKGKSSRKASVDCASCTT